MRSSKRSEGLRYFHHGGVQRDLTSRGGAFQQMIEACLSKRVLGVNGIGMERGCIPYGSWRVLLREDQALFDDPFRGAREHFAAMGQASGAFPIDAVLLAILVNERRAIL